MAYWYNSTFCRWSRYSWSTSASAHLVDWPHFSFHSASWKTKEKNQMPDEPALPKLQIQSQAGLKPLHIHPGYQGWWHYLTKTDLKFRIVNSVFAANHKQRWKHFSHDFNPLVISKTPGQEKVGKTREEDMVNDYLSKFHCQKNNFADMFWNTAGIAIYKHT